MVMTERLKRIAGVVATAIRGRKSREEAHQFWRHPDAANLPEGYLAGGARRSEFLVDLVKRRVKSDDEILEIGCNVGRNLHHLSAAGFSKLAGIEINEAAVRKLGEAFPDLAASARLVNEPVESAIKRFRDDEFALVYTMAVLEHIHTDSEWVFGEMVRIARNAVITIEDERGISRRHFPRDYGKVFGALGLKEIETADCSAIEGLGSDFRARVFVKPAARRAAAPRW
jgi:SAM-dependent methyltransferase